MGSNSGRAYASPGTNTGENKFYGDYLVNAQGEDVVAGIRTPIKLSDFEKHDPKAYKAVRGSENAGNTLQGNAGPRVYGRRRHAVHAPVRTESALRRPPLRSPLIW